MATNHNFAGLDWVAGEISETLKEAREALDAHAREPGDESQLSRCMERLHQVNGSLQMIEFYGAALLAEEVEALLKALLNARVKDTSEAQEVLMRAILELPAYLDRVKTTRVDDPAALLPLLNALRAVRGAAPLPHNQFFDPDLSAARMVSGEPHPAQDSNPQFKSILSKVRKMYRYAAASVLRGLEPEQNLAYLHKATSRLFSLTAGTRRQPLWDLALGVTDGLVNGQLPIDESIHSLLRQLDREIQLLAAGGIKALDDYSDDEILKSLLFYLAHGGIDSPRSQRLRAQYGLGTEVPASSSSIAADQRSALGGPDAETMRTVVAALNEELADIKEALDGWAFGRDEGAIEQALPIMLRVADTLSVLGVGELRTQLLAQAEALESAWRSGDLDRGQLAQVAEQVVALEHHLAIMATANLSSAEAAGRNYNRVHIDQAQMAVLREARNGLEQVKIAVIGYIASQWDRTNLEPVPELLNGIIGGLNMIPLQRPARILRGCRLYVLEHLLQPADIPEWSDLDALADAVAGVEYYLERLSKGGDEDEDLLLASADQSITALGYPTNSGAPTAVGKAAAQDQAESAIRTDQRDQAAATIVATMSSAGADGSASSAPFAEQFSAWERGTEPLSETRYGAEDEAGELTSQPFSRAQQSPELPNFESRSAALQTPGLQTPAAQEPASQEQGAAAPLTGAASPSSLQPEAEDNDAEADIDDEIVAIFIEEAGEVLATIDDYLPRWAGNFADQDALAELRRAFHTLKGSGRMVAAQVIGELAWAVEQLLNRLLDGGLPPQPQQALLLQQVWALLPSLVSAFEQGRANPAAEQVNELIAAAAVLAAGGVPEPVQPGADAGPESDARAAADGAAVPQHMEPPVAPATELATAAAALAGGAQEPVPVPEPEPVTEPVPEQDHETAALDLSATAESAQAHINDAQSVASEAQPNSSDAQPATTEPEFAVAAAAEAEVDIGAGVEAVVKTGVETEDQAEDEDEDYNAVLWDIFGSEALTHLQTVSEFIDAMEQAAPLYAVPSDDLQRALHTLKGSAHMADIHDIAALATPLERFTKELRSYQLEIDADVLQLFRDAVTYIHGALEELRQGRTASIDKLEQFQARVAELRELFISPFAHRPEQAPVKAVDPQVLAMFMAEEMDLLIDADDLLDGWSRQPQQCERWEELVSELKALASGAGQANLPALAELSTQLAAVYSAARGDLSALEEDGFDQLQIAHEQLLDMVDAVAAGQNLRPFDDQLLLSLAQLATPREDLASTPAAAPTELAVAPAAGSPGATEQAPGEPEIPPLAPSGVATFAASVDAGGWVTDEEQGVADEHRQFDDYGRAATEAAGDAELDAEIVEIFVEEAHELMEDIEQAVHEWSQDWLHGESGEVLKRALHTYKGGARLAGLMGLGDIAHDFETDIVTSVQGNAVNGEFFSRIHAYQDRLLKGLEQVRTRLTATSGQPQPGVSGGQQPAPQATGFEAAAQPAAPLAAVLPFAPKDNIPLVRSGARPPSAPLPGEFLPAAGSARPAPVRRFAPQEVVKISAELLEELVNLAGETSISRGRMEEQMSEQGFAIEEMAATIARLQEQLRRLDIETEAQILFRQEQLAESQDFDPLEMDRYSQLQQLSRSLIESASDLMDLKNTLADKTRDTETLLLQQSRINTDLQEGLMRSRMVPFARMVPRLRRIVRQVSTELNKSVNLEIDNAEGELDRTVLERMVAPLEHMLRNAIDHGIEAPRERLERGKLETGNIRLSLSREGSNVLLRLVDDGRGINLEKVRAKAIERGLMAPEANLSDSDMMQFILHAGFSTVDAVTQISGRGVGMDVVHAEIKQLGGSMAIYSRWGEGTEFAIRLPFTVSVNRALMVRIGDDRYAIPLNTIEGIVRVSPFELEHYYRDDKAVFEYAGEEYRVRYLGSLLNSDARPKLELQSMPLPVVLVRTEKLAAAIQVDMLMGSREIVVKSLGPQFGGVLGVSGATVMGDGSVVVILDPHAMIRQQAALAHAPEPILKALPAKPEREIKTVMVVDDSVTVRKVTSRFLEREGYEVSTAKDGADALMQLQDHIPDIMLLDIEMPRMDGFEVAKNMRASNRLKGIPIIMITSRTGAKHRQRAFDLGVNKYLGKPYQEELLLHNIQLLTGAEGGANAAEHTD